MYKEASQQLQRKILQIVVRPRSTIQFITDLHCERNMSQYMPRSERPQKFSMKKNRLVLRPIKKGSSLSDPKVRAELAIDISVSKCTIRNVF